MEEIALGITLGLLVMAVVGLGLRLEACHRGIVQMADNLQTAFKRDIEEASLNTSDSFVDTIREDLLETVNGVIQNMQPPTIVDHLGGVIQQFAQMKLMKAMKEEGMIPDQLAQMVQGEQQEV